MVNHPGTAFEMSSRCSTSSPKRTNIINKETHSTARPVNEAESPENEFRVVMKDAEIFPFGGCSGPYFESHIENPF